MRGQLRSVRSACAQRFVAQRVDGVADAGADHGNGRPEDGDLPAGGHAVGNLNAADKAGGRCGAFVLALPRTFEQPPATWLGVPATTRADVVGLAVRSEPGERCSRTGPLQVG